MLLIPNHHSDSNARRPGRRSPAAETGPFRELPGGSPVEIIDPFVNFDPTGEGFDVPMPRQALRDRESLAAWPSTDMTGHLFKKDEAKEARLGWPPTSTVVQNLDDWKISRAQVLLVSTQPNEVFDRLSMLGRPAVRQHQGRPPRRHGRRAPDRRAGPDVSLRPQCVALADDDVPAVPAELQGVLPGLHRSAAKPTSRCSSTSASPAHGCRPGPKTRSCSTRSCWCFPDLRVVMRHGGEPWVETCVRMLLRWPNLYYATTGFAPKYYPKPIIDLLNTRGREKVVWAGYWPMLGYDRIFAELSRAADPRGRLAVLSAPQRPRRLRPRPPRVAVRRRRSAWVCVTAHVDVRPLR